ncbi:histidine kinase [Mucilaginibacter yixingensis]|uniref:Histidine kinase n=1 Tax=Mucilaginibacter yixingensis TaxID=1295612 RepID=A0A2T5JEI3_9SPHI|nr:histidine kinase [Mucilaginibacter yixingensis]PTR00852.1 histidine kinase [Mucilaginibacter yixingensis]
MKPHRYTYHLLFWLLAYVFWIFIFRNTTLVLSHAITVQFCYLVFIASNYYFNELYTVPRLLSRKRYVAFGAAFLAGVIVGAALRVPVSYWVNRFVFKSNVAHFNITGVFLESFINILFWTVLILAAKLIADRIRSQRYIEQIENERAANELNFLRAQFNPHFLFNSINSIYAHIDRSNKTARNMLLVFSEMLRYQLYECNVEQIELDKEIAYISNYIALQKSRMDDRINVQFSHQIDGHVCIAPLMLITFIENAFKYVGFDEQQDNRITIQLKYSEARLEFAIFNTKDGFLSKLPEDASGLGIANVKRRLELLYPDRHNLKINDDGAAFTVNLTLWGL